MRSHGRNSSQRGPDAAANAYAVLFDAEAGFVRKGEFDAEGITQVLALRARYGTPQKRLGEAGSYCDLSFLEEAMALQGP